MPRSRRTKKVVVVATPVRVASVTSRSSSINQPKPRRRRSRRSTTSNVSSALGCSNTVAYINTLKNPFEFPGIRIGFGCLTGSQLATGYFRDTFTASSDGYLGIFMFPALGPNALYVNNATGGSAAWNGSPYSNYSALTPLMSECRIVSAGIKVLPLVPATGSPGVVYAGALPSQTISNMLASSLPTLIQSPFLELGYAATGASAVSHPVDMGSFIFSNNWVSIPATNILSQNSVPLIILAGLPAGCTVVCEAMMNVEYLPVSLGAAQVNPNSDFREADSGPTMTSSYPSLEEMWSSVKRFVPTSATINQATSTISSLATLASRRSRAHELYRRVVERDQVFEGPALMA
jgi:hypothetical protein